MVSALALSLVEGGRMKQVIDGAIAVVLLGVIVFVWLVSFGVVV